MWNSMHLSLLSFCVCCIFLLCWVSHHLRFCSCLKWMCYFLAAHRYQQAKASGQGSHSKSSSAHSSRSTSPGPHWRNESIASRTTERQPLDPSGNSSSSPCRQGRSHRPSVFTERESSTGRTPPLLSRPNRDHSEPRHFKPFRCDCVCLCILVHFLVL